MQSCVEVNSKKTCIGCVEVNSKNLRRDKKLAKKVKDKKVKDKKVEGNKGKKTFHIGWKWVDGELVCIGRPKPKKTFHNGWKWIDGKLIPVLIEGPKPHFVTRWDSLKPYVPNPCWIKAEKTWKTWKTSYVPNACWNYDSKDVWKLLAEHL